MSAPTPEWNIARIVIAHDCNEGRIPAIEKLISQLESFHRNSHAGLLAAAKLLRDCDFSPAAMERGLTTPQANQISRAIYAACQAIAKAEGCP